MKAAHERQGDIRIAMSRYLIRSPVAVRVSGHLIRLGMHHRSGQSDKMFPRPARLADVCLLA